jgi:hypothetical protein
MSAKRAFVGWLAIAYTVVAIFAVGISQGFDYQLDQSLFPGCQEYLVPPVSTDPLASAGSDCAYRADPVLSYSFWEWRFSRELGLNPTRWVHRYIPVDAGLALTLAAWCYWPVLRRRGPQLS